MIFIRIDNQRVNLKIITIRCTSRLCFLLMKCTEKEILILCFWKLRNCMLIWIEIHFLTWKSKISPLKICKFHHSRLAFAQWCSLSPSYLVEETCLLTTMGICTTTKSQTISFVHSAKRLYRTALWPPRYKMTPNLYWLECTLTTPSGLAQR